MSHDFSDTCYMASFKLYPQCKNIKKVLLPDLIKVSFFMKEYWSPDLNELQVTNFIATVSSIVALHISNIYVKVINMILS